MARTSTRAFEQVIKLNLAKFSPEAAKKKHIEIARKKLHSFLDRQVIKPEYIIRTDGVISGTEDTVRPFGVIRYTFLRMGAVGQYVINIARDQSPNKSGRYKKSWFLIADGKEVNELAIPGDTKELILTNDQPYARKINVRGARLRGVPPGIIERVKQFALRRFRNMITVEVQYLTLQRGYTLKRDYIQTRRSGKQRVRDKAGTELKYPALVIRQII